MADIIDVSSLKDGKKDLYIAENTKIINDYWERTIKDEKIRGREQDNLYKACALGIVSPEELKSELEFLEENNCYIRKASEIKVLANTLSDMKNKFALLGEIHELAVYSNVNNLNLNVIDVYKRIQWCKKDSIEYKNADGSYKEFILDSDEWGKLAERAKNLEENIKPSISFEPIEEKKEENKPAYEFDLKEMQKQQSKLEETRTDLINEVNYQNASNEEFRNSVENDLNTEVVSIDKLFNDDMSLETYNYEKSYGRAA